MWRVLAMNLDTFLPVTVTEAAAQPHNTCVAKLMTDSVRWWLVVKSDDDDDDDVGANQRWMLVLVC